MKDKVQVGIILTSLFFINTNLFSQTVEWKTEKTKDGKITVKNRISKRTGANGKEEQLVEYVATTTTSASMKNLISIVKDVSKHKEFMSQETSIKVKALSDYECIVYYFYQGFWPYPSSDIVAKMIYKEDVAKRIASFTLTSAPSMLEDKGVKRLDFYNLTYTFKDIENGNVEITITTKFTPAVQLPSFIMSSWFPDGPAGYLVGIIKLAKEGS
jgi:hypothetical protein